MEFLNEHLFPGKLGHFFVILSFVAALLSTVAYFFATQKRNLPDESAGWLKIGRLGFWLHGASVFGVIGCLFYILTNKFYEYQYAWSNISDDLPFQYTFSAFWKEQQGSFLLWSFWHVWLGAVLIFRAKKWEAPVLTVVGLAEVFISSMILGIYFGDFRLGASPFDLMRDVMEGPIFAQADYLTKISGQGLNPLLQNYWMTIHPPTLFLGFASTVVPCAFAIAGLWTREHKDWLRPALNWSLFSGAILGLGILMGGAWAYEALSFGGYWAWDPVENASLVPWIVMIAGIHTNLVARSTGYSIRSTYIFYILSFILILYSTYLTRSGILGDTSAHAFTEMGLEIQLILFMLVFLGLGKWLMLSRWKGIPEIKKEEATSSREFWMFIGSLTLFFSAVLITGATSLPVYNKIIQIFSPEYKGIAIADPVEHHNRFQLWIAVFIGLFSGVAQWLRYSEKNFSSWFKKMGWPIGISILAAAGLTFLNSLWLKNEQWFHFVMLFAAMFTLTSNAIYLFSFLTRPTGSSGREGNLKMASSVISHVGFGVLALGILGTGLNKEWISTNPFAMEGLIEGFGKDDLQKNVLLLREASMPLAGNLNATYQKDTVERQTRTFSVKFQRRDAAGNPTGESFVLNPNVMYDRQFTKVVASNPSTQHYWNYDIFTHVSSLPKAELDPDFAKSQEDSLKFLEYKVKIGDTIFTQKHFVTVDGLTASPAHKDYKSAPGDIVVGLKMTAHSLENEKTFPVVPLILIRPGEGGFNVDDKIGQLAMRFRLPDLAGPAMLAIQNYKIKDGQEIDFNDNKIKFVGFDKNAQHPDYQAMNGDIAVSALLEITTPDGKVLPAKPIYLIRGGQVSSLAHFLESAGIGVRFEAINPTDETATFTFSQPKTNPAEIPVLIAENGARSDYIVLEAILFPGINLVWTGSLMMLFGMALSLFLKKFQKNMA